MLVWDAGLGTLFDALSFPMPYGQPRPVIEALLRRITGVRFLLVGHLEEASAQVVAAQALLEENPIDRSYQVRVDAENQFEVFLLTEMQERFALGHELAHYLKEVDPAAFETLSQCALEAARIALQVGDPPTVFSDVLDYQSNAVLYDLYKRDLNPYAWYLFDRNQHSRQNVSCQSWAEEAALAVEVLESGPPAAKEEVICDLLAGLSVALDAHNRQNGWTAILAAACSRLALSNLETILGIDDWVSGRAPGAKTPQASVTTRQRCLNVLLAQMLPEVLGTHGLGSKLVIGDIHSVMHLVESRYKDRLHAALSKIDHAEPSRQTDVLDGEDVLLLAGFMFMRPSADHRTVNRAAGRHKFELGSVYHFPGVMALFTAVPEFARGIEEALRRHQRGDWGDGMPQEDCDKNDAGLYQEFEPPSAERKRRRDALWSQYKICDESVLIITARDRQETQVLLAREYYP